LPTFDKSFEAKNAMKQEWDILPVASVALVIDAKFFLGRDLLLRSMIEEQ
jgi:hypothetical protein